MGTSQWGERRARVAPLLAGLAAVVALLACAAPGIGGSGSATTRGGAAPCAMNTPHAALAQGGGIIAVVFLWFPPLPDGTVPASGPTSSLRETVCILKEDDGALLAHYDIAATGVYVSTPPQSLFAISPDSSVLYVSAMQTQSTRLCAVGALTGATLWCMQMVGYIEQAAVDDHALYLLENGALKALDPASGQTLWQQSGFDTDQHQPMVLDGDRIYEVTSHGITLFDELCAWRAEDGKAAWCTHSYYDQPIFQFSEGGGYATLVLRLRSSLLVQELRASDGTQVWQQRLTGLEPAQPNQTFNAGSGVYIEAQVNGRLDYQLLALDVATGAREWARDDGSNMLALYGGTNGIAAMRNGTALGYLPASSTSSAPAWQTRLIEGGGAQLFVAPQAVYYLADGPGALRSSDGKRLWEAESCASGSESTPGHAADGATIWCHWPNVGVGIEIGTVSGVAML